MTEARKLAMPMPDLAEEKPGADEPNASRRPHEKISLKVSNLDLFYGDQQALNGINMEIPEKKVTAFIGPSGCGKSTLLRCFNRMNDLVDSVRITGSILLHDENIYAPNVNVANLRRRVGMVFQKPNPFPKSIYENVAYGLRIQGVKNRRTLDKAVELLRDKYPAAAAVLEDGGPDALTYMTFPDKHRRQIHSTNPLERLNREIKRRAAVVGIFPNNASALRLITMILAEQHDEWAVGRRYFSLESMAAISSEPTPQIEAA